MTRILLLGGTTEASLLARALAEAGGDAVFSYAGRTDHPVAQPLPMRVGGFGGVGGLVGYLRAENIGAVVDATHPFAAQMSRNAVEACGLAGVPLIGLERAAWAAEAGDNWLHVASIEAAIAALPDAPARVFLAIGKQNLSGFAAKPHHYLLRLVDAPESSPLPDCTVVLARGPFEVVGDKTLMLQHKISHIVAKNAGGAGAAAKLVAARDLGIPVILIERPALPARRVVGSVAEVMAWLSHADLGV
ncbi:precorrin-6A reductase [Cypionkella aquatica]|uniref:Precorrin-6A reductase n=1 Tax=Cypionkella aquatica TaxID=1756042 RepID=A0AA37X188_9RHOB|nr:cobalt-precorrin-6A reductase [Cypionkella aquatica]GLS86525.1 precorrin-6A reductase [Cypionkella aquatica]